MLEAETLIGHCILLEKAMNMKIRGVVLLLGVFSLDSKLV